MVKYLYLIRDRWLKIRFINKKYYICLEFRSLNQSFCMTDGQAFSHTNGSDKAFHFENQVLVLHNDSVNTFEHVIQTLVEECGHEEIQAEQCAILTHCKGQCEILTGSLFELQYIKNKLFERGLTVTILEP